MWDNLDCETASYEPFQFPADGIKQNGRRVSFNNDPEIRYRTESEASSASTSRKDNRIPGMEDYEFHSIDQNVNTYSRKKEIRKSNVEKSEKETLFDQLLDTKCSWSYKQMNTTNDEGSSSLQKNVPSPPFISNVEKNESNSTTKRNTLKTNGLNESKQNAPTKISYRAEDKHASTSSFDDLLPQKNLSTLDKNKDKSYITRERKNLRSLKPVYYANDSSSDEELVFQSRIDNRSKFGNSDEEDIENGMKNESESKDTPGNTNFDDSQPCDILPNLKRPDTKNFSNVLNQDSNVDTLQKGNIDDESKSENILTANEESNESFGLKNIKTPHSPHNSTIKDSTRNILRKDNIDEESIFPNVLLLNDNNSKESLIFKNTGIPNSSDNSLNNDSYLSILSNINENNESVSLNVSTNKTKSKRNGTKLEKIIKPFQDSKKQTKSKTDNIVENNISSNDGNFYNCHEKRTRKSLTAKDKDIEKSIDSDFNISFFRTSFPGLSNDEVISEVIGDDISVFDDYDTSTKDSFMKEPTESIQNVSSVIESLPNVSNTKHLSNRNQTDQGFQGVIQKSNQVKEISPSMITLKGKRNSNAEDFTLSIETDDEAENQTVSKKCKKKTKNKDKLVEGLPQDIKDICDEINLEVLSIGNKSDMTGTLSEEDEFTRDFMDGKLDCNKLLEYCKTIQNNQSGENRSKHLNLSSKIQTESEFDSCLHENVSNKKQHKTQNHSSVSTNKREKTNTIHPSNLRNEDTLTDTPCFQQLTGKKQNVYKYKAEKSILGDNKKAKRTKTSMKKPTSQDQDDLQHLFSNDSNRNEGSLTVKNISNQSVIEKRESKSKRRNKNTTEEIIHLSTPSVSPKFLTVPVKRKQIAELVTLKTDSVLKVEKKGIAEILDSEKKTPMRSWEDLEVELLSDANENKKANEESFLFLTDEDSNGYSSNEKLKTKKVAEKHKNGNTCKRFSVHEHHSKNTILNGTLSKRRSPQMKYVFNIPEQVDKKETSHDGKRKSTSLVPYTSSKSIVEKTIENMNLITSSYLQQSSEKDKPSKGRNSDRNYIDGVPVEFSYSIQQIKSTMYIKPSKRVEITPIQNEISNSGRKFKYSKQNRIKDNIISPISSGQKILPTLSIAKFNKELEDGIPSLKNKLEMRATQKQNVEINSRVTGKQEKLVSSRKVKKNDKNKHNISTLSSEDEITDKTYINNGEQLDFVKDYNTGKRKLQNLTEKSNLGSKRPKKEFFNEKTRRGEMKRKTKDLSEEEITFRSGKQQKTRQEMKQGIYEETKKVMTNKKDTSNKDVSSSDSSEGYQTIERIKESLLKGNDKMNSLADDITKNRHPPTLNTKETASKSTMSSFKPSSSKDTTAQARKDVENYLKYLNNIFKTDSTPFKGKHKGENEPKMGKQIEDDDVFSISSIDSDTDKEVPNVTGLLCNQFD